MSEQKESAAFQRSLIVLQEIFFLIILSALMFMLNISVVTQSSTDSLFRVCYYAKVQTFTPLYASC